MPIHVYDKSSNTVTILDNGDPVVHVIEVQGGGEYVVMDTDKFESAQELCKDEPEFFAKVVMSGRKIHKFVNGEPLKLTGFDAVIADSADDRVLTALVAYATPRRHLAPVDKTRINKLLAFLKKSPNSPLMFGSSLVSGRMAMLHSTFMGRRVLFGTDMADAATLVGPDVIAVYRSPNFIAQMRDTFGPAICV